MPKDGLDITKSIKMIEQLQCELLNLIAQLFSSMQDVRATTQERGEILANMEMILQLLSAKLGVSHVALTQKCVSRLKLGLAEEGISDEWRSSLLGLLRHMEQSGSGR